MNEVRGNRITNNFRETRLVLWRQLNIVRKEKKNKFDILQMTGRVKKFEENKEQGN